MSRTTVSIISIGGAGGNVTGSAELVRIHVHGNDFFGLIDCGISQGKDEMRNWHFPLDGKNLDFVITTHAHMDHMGALPLLRNYKGKVYGTKDAFVKGKELLIDAAMNYERMAIEELGFTPEVYHKIKKDYNDITSRPDYEDKEFYQELRDVVEEVKSASLYTLEDVEAIQKHFQNTHLYSPFVLARGVQAKLIPNNHQDGAVSVELMVGEADDTVRILFSGDIGPESSLLYRSMSDKKDHEVQYCYIEGTHGTEEMPQTLDEAIRVYEHTVMQATKKGKVVITALFSLERMQQILYVLNNMIDQYQLDVPIYLDSKLGAIQTGHYQNSYRESMGKSHWFKHLGKDPFDTSEIIVCKKHYQHMDAIMADGAKIILTASAFGEGGRILDYFEKYIQDSNAVFIFPAWLSPDCNSYRLHHTEQGQIVDIINNHAEYRYVKRCKTIQFEGFTQHVYYPGLLRFLQRYPYLQGVVVNHYEEAVGQKLQEKLSEDMGCPVVIADLYDNIDSDQSMLEFTAEGMKKHYFQDCARLFDKVLLG